MPAISVFIDEDSFVFEASCDIRRFSHVEERLWELALQAFLSNPIPLSFLFPLSSWLYSMQSRSCSPALRSWTHILTLALLGIVMIIAGLLIRRPAR